MKLGQPLAQMITFGKERPVAILTLCFLAAVGGKTFLFLTKGLAALALERFQLSPEVGILSIDPRDTAPVQHFVTLAVVRRTSKTTPSRRIYNAGRTARETIAARVFGHVDTVEKVISVSAAGPCQTL